MLKPILFIPYVNREDLLSQAWDSVNQDFNVCVIDNSPRQDLDKVATRDYQVYTPDIPLNFVYTQNLMLKLANQMQVPYYGFMHNDGKAIGDTPKKLIEYADNMIMMDEKFSVLFTYYDVLAIFNTDAFNVINGWSVYFNQYYADSDTYRRLRLAGYPTIDTGLPCEHYNKTDASATIQNDPKRAFHNAVVSGMFAGIYELRWGGPNEHEKYLSPFNKGDLTI